jgi:hypothetical protein
MILETKPFKTGNYYDAIADQKDGFILPSFEELEELIKHSSPQISQQKELLTRDLIEGTNLIKGLVFYYFRIIIIKEVQLNKNDQFNYILIKIIQ